MKILKRTVGRFQAPDALLQQQASLAQALTMHATQGTVRLAGEKLGFCPATDSAAIHEFLAWLRFDRCIQIFEVEKNQREPGACADGQDRRD